MRRYGIALCLTVALVTGSAYGAGTMNPTNGLNAYWLIMNGAGGTWLSYQVDDRARDPGWATGSYTTVNKITAAAATVGGWGFTYTYFNQLSLDMWDPQANPFTGAPTSGLGRTIFWAHVPEGTTNAAPENWTSIVRATPKSTYDLISKGWADGTYIGQALLKAPGNQLGLNTNGLAVLGSYNNRSGPYYMSDAGGDGYINNEANEVLYTSGNAYYCGQDWEFGPDQAVYMRGRKSNGEGGNQMLFRSFLHGSTTAPRGTTQDYVDLKALSGKVVDGYTVGGAGWGVAIGPSHTGGKSAPIVYFAAHTTGVDEDCGSINSSRMSILAAQDLNADNVITLGTDTLTLLWRNGRFIANGLTYNYDEDGNIADIEYDSVSQSLVLGDTWGSSYGVLALDNTTGLSVIGGLQFGNLNNNGGGLYNFEIDPIPFPSGVIPEPATLLLIGTGALGVFGWMRRRSMR